MLLTHNGPNGTADTISRIVPDDFSPIPFTVTSGSIAFPAEPGDTFQVRAAARISAPAISAQATSFYVEYLGPKPN